MPRGTRRAAVVWMLALAAGAALAGCKGGGGQPAGDGTTSGGAPTADAQPSSAPAKCGAGATANESPPFCYVVPPSMKKRTVDPIKKKGRYQLIYKDGAKGSVISFIAWDPGAFDATWKALQANAAASKATDVKTEDLDGGKAKLLTYTTPGTTGRSIASYLVRGTKQTLECEVDIDKHLPTDKLIDVCKQMHEL